MSQIHKRFTSDQVKNLLSKYLKGEIDRKYIQEILAIKKRRFFSILKSYRDDKDSFSIGYKKSQPKRIDPEIEDNIIKELTIDQEIINNPQIPLINYNYSYIKRRLDSRYNQKVSVPTIIKRAKENDFYLKKKKKKKIHDREVLTNYPGEMIQHDSSQHLWAPDSREKWYLITSLDDYSRFILFGQFVKRETTFKHIKALESVVLRHGLPYSYYVDCHSIFRFVRGRDSFWHKHHKLTDDIDPQWKMVMNECKIKIIYALSPQAKGKVERPYRWLQDNLIRSCVRENITNIRDAQAVLNREIKRYNYKQIHSTTQEIPFYKFKNAIDENKSLFRDFKTPAPFRSVKDIFSLKITRFADAYRRVSINNIKFKVNRLNPRDEVVIRIYPLNQNISEIRFWVENQLLDIQKIKNADLKGVQF